MREHAFRQFDQKRSDVHFGENMMINIPAHPKTLIAGAT
jgi:hypothetical protein